MLDVYIHHPYYPYTTAFEASTGVLDIETPHGNPQYTPELYWTDDKGERQSMVLFPGSNITLRRLDE